MTDNISKEKAQAYGISVPPTKQGDTLSPNQIAKILGVSGARVRIWINTGRLSAVRRPNGYWVVTVSDLERFLESRQRVRLRVLFNGPSSAKQKIEQLGYEVVEATNLTDAMLKLASAGVSLIILEVASKRIPVFDLLQQKKRFKLTKLTPVLLLGAIADADVSRAAALDVKGVLSEIAALPDEINRVLTCS